MRAVRTAAVAACLAACAGPEAGPAAPVVAVTWNVGSGGAADPAAGWTADLAERADTWLGNGLAWPPAIDDARAWLATSGAQLVALQEVLDPGTTCPTVPPEQAAGLRCETWAPGDASVARDILPAGAELRCMDGAPDKCLAVVPPLAFVEVDDLLEGVRVDGCGGRSRVGAADVSLPGGGAWRVVAVHGTSGLTGDDQACRTAWFEAALSLAGDGPSLLLGDFNTDPLRLAGIDASADALAALTATWTPLRPLDAPASYGGFATIDHAFGRGVSGACVAPGVDPGIASASDNPAFDHHPLRCTLDPP